MECLHRKIIKSFIKSFKIPIYLAEKWHIKYLDEHNKTFGKLKVIRLKLFLGKVAMQFLDHVYFARSFTFQNILKIRQIKVAWEFIKDKVATSAHYWQLSPIREWALLY